MISGMIFDLDGVLVDTAKLHYLAWKRLAEEMFGIPFTEADNARFKGVNRVACMTILCEMAGKQLSPDAFHAGMAQKNAWYVDMVRGMGPDDILPGALEYVLKMREKGIRLAIGSASKNCALVLERTGIRPLFDAVSDGTVATKAKPDPEVFIRAAQMLGVAPDACVVFEDAQAGIDAAKSGGIRCCAIGSPGALSGYDWIFPSLIAIGNAIC